MPVVFVSLYSPVQGRSVPAWRSTAYSSGVSSARHCSSVLCTGNVVMPCSARQAARVFRAREFSPPGRAGAGGFIAKAAGLTFVEELAVRVRRPPLILSALALAGPAAAAIPAGAATTPAAAGPV